MNLATLTPLLISMLCAFAASLLVLKSVSPLANKFGLLDHPDDRKQHSGSIPLTGGIAITAGALIAFVIFQQLATTTPTTSYILLGGALMLILGTIDDVNHFSWRKRVLGQIIISVITLKITGLSVHTIVGFDLTSIPGLSLGFTLLAIIGLTNAFNLIDGIDGLAGGIALITIANLFIFSTPNVALADGAYLVLISAALLPYLYANLLGRKEAKVFLGDSGSYMLGFVIAMSLINFSEGTNPTLSTSSVLWCAALPILDTIGVMLRRLRNGQSPFQPDRRHLHHLLMNKGMSSRVALSWLIGIAATLSIGGLLIERYLAAFSIPLFIALILIYTKIACSRLDTLCDNTK